MFVWGGGGLSCFSLFSHNFIGIVIIVKYDQYTVYLMGGRGGGLQPKETPKNTKNYSYCIILIFRLFKAVKHSTNSTMEGNLGS